LTGLIYQINAFQRDITITKYSLNKDLKAKQLTLIQHPGRLFDLFNYVSKTGNLLKRGISKTGNLLKQGISKTGNFSVLKGGKRTACMSELDYSGNAASRLKCEVCSTQHFFAVAKNASALDIDLKISHNSLNDWT